MEDKIFKIWGIRNRIHLGTQYEIDMLTLKACSFCSTHSHKIKTNKFCVVSGRVGIETEYGAVTLTKGESFTVLPNIIHRFIALEDSVMLEVAYSNDVYDIDPNDIKRIKQGGRIVSGKEVTEDKLRKKGLLDLKKEN